MARKLAVSQKKVTKSSKNQPASIETLFKKRSLVLTERERNVLKFFARGHTYQEIGDKLGISPKTVGSYLQRVREKIRAKSRSELITMAVREGLISEK